MMRVQGIRRTGSAALDLAYVACGRVDGFWEFGLKPWDVAAGALIVEEAGGHVSNIDGSPLDLAGAQIVASNGQLHQQMMEVLAITRPEAERRHAEMLREAEIAGHAASRHASHRNKQKPRTCAARGLLRRRQCNYSLGHSTE